MCRQIKTEFYKLFHTTALGMLAAFFVGLFVVFSVCGEVQIMVSGLEDEAGWRIGETIGFFVRTYEDAGHPMIEEVVRTATSFTSFFWLAVLVFSVMFFSREYTDSTIKIAVAGGKSRSELFLAKYIVIAIAGGALYFLFMAIALLEECVRMQLSVDIASMEYLLKIFELNCLIMLAFIGISLMTCVVFRHTAVVVGILSLFIFSGPVIYMMVWDTMQFQPWPLRLYVKINPMYYWMNLCAYNMKHQIAASAVAYFLITTIVTISISLLILRKKEIK